MDVGGCRRGCHRLSPNLTIHLKKRSPRSRVKFCKENLGEPAICRTPGADRSPARWTADGPGVAYAEKGNLWVQSLDGGPPRQLTRFAEGRPIVSFAWSRDGKRFANVRTSTTDDIVLIKGLKQGRRPVDREDPIGLTGLIYPPASSLAQYGECVRQDRRSDVQIPHRIA